MFGGEPVDDIGEEMIHTSVESLKDTLAEAFAVWAVYHRGAEGITEHELMLLLNKIWPNPKWVAIYACRRDWAIEALKRGWFDPDHEHEDDTGNE